MTDKPPSPAKLDWDDVRVFAAIAQTGSLSAAARLIGVTPGSVSKRLEELESRLQAKLTTRHPSGVTLTEAGEVVRDHALTMQRSAEAIELAARERDTRPEGRVTIACPDGTAAYWITPGLARFVAEHPKIRVGLDCGFWANDPMPDMPELSVVVEKDERKLDQVFVPLAAFHYAMYASKDYIAAHGAPQSFAALADHKTIHLVAQSKQRENWNPRAAAIRQLLVPNIETNSSAVTMEAVRRGAGVAVLPTAIHTVAPDLVMIDPAPVSKIQLWLCYHRDAMKTTRLRVVAEWLKSIFDPRHNPWFRDEFVHPSKFEN